MKFQVYGATSPEESNREEGLKNAGFTFPKLSRNALNLSAGRVLELVFQSDTCKEFCL